MITITPAAIEEINRALAKYDNEKYVRLNMGVGWGGPRLELTLEESAATEDSLYELEGIKFLIHDKKKPYFDQTKLDYVKGWFGGEFKLLRV